MTSVTNELEFYKQKCTELIVENLALAERLSYQYNPDKPMRPLTLQEKLEINMGNTLKKYRIPVKDLKNIHYTIMRDSREKEYEFIDITFDVNRMFEAWYEVDLEKEKEEIEKGEGVELTVEAPAEIEQKYDVEKVLNQITAEIKEKK